MTTVDEVTVSAPDDDDENAPKVLALVLKNRWWANSVQDNAMVYVAENVSSQK